MYNIKQPSGDNSNKIKSKNQKLKSKNYFAFTLVELIVVIVILSILATIAFLSFNSYSSQSRDSVRLSDINSLNKSLELFNVNASKYPDPTNVYTRVVYSGGVIFEQGNAGDSVLTAIQKVNKKPIDPLDNSEYTYSTNLLRTSFQLKGELENKPSTGYNGGIENGKYKIENDGNNLKDISTSLRSAQYDDNGGYAILNSIQNLLNNEYTHYNKILADSNGGSRICYVKGNFNGLIEKTNTGNTNYILAVPGLIVNEENNLNLDYNTLSGKVICNGMNNPCIVTYLPTVVFVGSGNSIPTTIGDIGTIVGGLKNAYSGSNSSTTNTNILNILNSSGTSLLNLGASVLGKIGVTGMNNVSTSTTFPGCDTPDIILDNGQVWAACNVGASLAYTGVNISAGSCGASGNSLDCNSTKRNVLGKIFQWGRNFDLTSVGTLAGQQSTDNTSLFITNAVAPNYDWSSNSSSNLNLWGGSGTTWNAGTYITQGKPIAMQGPCASGYHVPTIYEWGQALSSLGVSINCSSASWQPINSSVFSVLRIPLGGFRDRSNASYFYQGTYGDYGTSTPYGTSLSYSAIFNVNNTFLPNQDYRGNGYSIRCLKN